MKILCLMTLIWTLGITGCLKTRAELRGDHAFKEDLAETPSLNAPSSAPVKTQIQEVKPEGGYVFDELRSEMTRLTGRVEDLERATKGSDTNPTPSQPAADTIKKLENRIIELEHAQAAMLEAIKKLQNTSAAAPVGNPTDLLSKGKSEAQAGNCEAAVDTLAPASTQGKGKVAEEATFLRAECFFQLKDYKKAIVDYSKFPERFGKSKYMPRALYQIARSFEALGMKEDATTFYQDLVEKFPKSAEGKKARSRVR